MPSPIECEIESHDNIQLPLGPEGQLVPFSPPPRPPAPPPPGLLQNHLLPYSLAVRPKEPPSPPPDSAEDQVVACSPQPQQKPTALEKIKEPSSPDSPLPQPPPSPPDSPQAEEPPPPQKRPRPYVDLVYSAVLCVIVFTLVALRSRNKRGN